MEQKELVQLREVEVERLEPQLRWTDEFFGFRKSVSKLVVFPRWQFPEPVNRIPVISCKTIELHTVNILEQLPTAVDTYLSTPSHRYRCTYLEKAGSC